MDPQYADHMLRTTVYLQRSQVERLRVVAKGRNMTGAAVIRAALEEAIGVHRPAPIGGFLAGGSRSAL
jgi:hypothetical protein